MGAMRPGDIVHTPHGRDWLLYPVLKTRRREGVVYINPKCYEIHVDEMLGTSSDVPSICPQNGEIGTRPEDMSTAGTYQEEMEL